MARSACSRIVLAVDHMYIYSLLSFGGTNASVEHRRGREIKAEIFIGKKNLFLQMRRKKEGKGKLLLRREEWQNSRSLSKKFVITKNKIVGNVAL